MRNANQGIEANAHPRHDGTAQCGFGDIAPAEPALRPRRRLIPHPWRALRVATNRLPLDDFALRCSARDIVVRGQRAVGVATDADINAADASSRGGKSHISLCNTPQELGTRPVDGRGCDRASRVCYDAVGAANLPLTVCSYFGCFGKPSLGIYAHRFPVLRCWKNRDPDLRTEIFLAVGNPRNENLRFQRGVHLIPPLSSRTFSLQALSNAWLRRGCPRWRLSADLSECACRIP